MSNSNPVNRRQFVKSSVAAAGIAAFAATGSACPNPASADGKRGDWWCIYDRDTSDRDVWIYYWRNCNTGATAVTIGVPGMPLGNCANAKNDSSCAEATVIFDWEQVNVGNTTFRIPPGLDAETKATGIRLITARPIRN